MQPNSVYQEEHIPTQFERFWRSYRRNNLAMFGLWCFILILLVTALSPWIAPHDPQMQSNQLLTPPSWDTNGTVDYFLGTDDLGPRYLIAFNYWLTKHRRISLDRHLNCRCYRWPNWGLCRYD